MMIYLYFAVILLVCIGLILFFKSYNNRQEKSKQKLKKVSEVAEPMTSQVQEQETNLEPQIIENASKIEKNQEFEGNFEDFSLEEEKSETKEDSKVAQTRETGNPFFRKKVSSFSGFDDESDDEIDGINNAENDYENNIENTEEDFSNYEFDESDALSNYKKMLEEERNSIKEDVEEDVEEDDDYFNSYYADQQHKQAIEMNERLKKMLLEDLRHEEEDGEEEAE